MTRPPLRRVSEISANIISQAETSDYLAVMEIVNVADARSFLGVTSTHPLNDFINASGVGFSYTDSEDVERSFDFITEINIHKITITRKVSDTVVKEYLLFARRDVFSQDNDTAIKNGDAFVYHDLVTNELSSRVASSGQSNRVFSVGTNSDQLGAVELLNNVEADKDQALVGIFEKLRDGTINAHTAKTNRIDDLDYLSDDLNQNFFSYWKGAAKTQFINKTVCNNTDVIMNNEYTLEPSRTEDSIELTFAGLRYLINKGNLSCVHSDIELLPSIFTINDPGTFAETEETMHKVLDYPINIIEIPGLDPSGQRAGNINTPPPVGIASNILPQPIPFTRLQLGHIFENGTGDRSFFSARTYDNLSDFFIQNEALRPLLSLIRPCITDYVPYNYSSDTSQASGTKSRNKNIRHLLPDITIADRGTDHPVIQDIVTPTPNSAILGRNTGSYFTAVEKIVNILYDVNEEHDNSAVIQTDNNYLFSYVENDIKHNVFWSQTRSPNMDPEAWGENLPNRAAKGSPGIVIHIQVENDIETETGIPLYNPYGNISKALNESLFAQTTSLVDTSFLKMPKTVKTLYLTYDYRDENIKRYFDNIDAMSTVVNTGEKAQPVFLSKISGPRDANPYQRSYIDDIKENLLWGLIYPNSDFYIRPRFNILNVIEVFYDGTDEVPYGFCVMPIIEPPSLINLCTSFSRNNVEIEENPIDYNNEDIYSEFRDIRSIPFYLRVLAGRFGAAVANRYANNTSLSRPLILRIMFALLRQLYNRDVFGGLLGLTPAYIQEDSSYPVVDSDDFPQFLRPYQMRPAPVRTTRGFQFVQVNFLRFFDKPTQDLVLRRSTTKDNILNLSGQGNVRRELGDRFNNTLVNYVAESAGLADSPLDVLGPRLILDREPSNQDAYKAAFYTKGGQIDEIVDIDADNAKSVFLGLKNSVRFLEGGLTDLRAGVSTLTNAGTDTNLESESRFVLHAEKNNIHQTKYVEEASGWVSDNINNEFQSIDDITNIVSLYNGHRLFFFYKEGSTILYVLTIGGGRKLRGFSEFDLRVPISSVEARGRDKLRITSDNVVYEMDFSLEAYEEDGSPVDYRDETGETEETRSQTYETRITTLPIFSLTDTEYSVFNSNGVTRAVVSFSGFAQFDIELERDNRRTIRKTFARYNTNEEGEAIVTEPLYHAGPVLLDALPNNAAPAPLFSIVKNNNRYLSINSVVLDLGDK